MLEKFRCSSATQNKVGHSGFETQRRRHQKSKTGISLAPQKGLMPSKFFFKKTLNKNTAHSLKYGGVSMTEPPPDSDIPGQRSPWTVTPLPWTGTPPPGQRPPAQRPPAQRPHGQWPPWNNLKQYTLVLLMHKKKVHLNTVGKISDFFFVSTKTEVDACRYVCFVCLSVFQDPSPQYLKRLNLPFVFFCVLFCFPVCLLCLIISYVTAASQAPGAVSQLTLDTSFWIKL